ncbi:mycofactocin-coupled SDR family oxidoreductase [Saccharopolyspora sp. TS4A08]|uniref:Mycofactocin-coupled SDR family oxidoreductase n=1 Tax=Saccharopolyspora ipomoeae TaxID=3042027 RepID=A0ABT6PRG5_9PSEU|nr:mycofactocin-coupled SDR family oxidoreductase [Saccharopolyspora sp. TS4A08]MDI2030549.1 mycofactocin-coupled SDR family oxidoreductase [Saccharopolyspora sp. TS4A08]
MGRLEGKVAFVTGAARGQGRSHAVRLAEEGADIIAVDLCDSIPSVKCYAPASADDLKQTAAAVEFTGRRVVSARVDVRDADALTRAVRNGVTELGRLDIVVANAGILELDPVAEVRAESWRDIIDINLTGVWNTVQAALPHMTSQGTGGSIVLTSSTAGLKGLSNAAPYTASKHGVVGLMKTLAKELGEHSIRVNTVNPTNVDTSMIQNGRVWGLFDPSNPAPTKESARSAFTTVSVLPVPWVETADVSNAVAFLASDEARYITGITMPIDAGFLIK